MLSVNGAVQEVTGCEQRRESHHVTFSSVLNLPSSDFQKIIRDLSCISDKIEIRSVTGGDNEHSAELVFKCSGGFAQAEVRRGENDGSMQYITKKSGAHIIQGEFSLKNLGYFIKCTNLCNYRYSRN